MKLSALLTIQMKVSNGLESADFPLTVPPDGHRQALEPIVALWIGQKDGQANGINLGHGQNRGTKTSLT